MSIATYIDIFTSYDSKRFGKITFSKIVAIVIFLTHIKVNNMLCRLSVDTIDKFVHFCVFTITDFTSIICFRRDNML